MDASQAIVHARLEEAGLREIEELAERDEIRSLQSFKEKVALLVVLTFCDKRESVYGFHRRLVHVFRKITKDAEAASGEQRMSFRRPVFRRNQPAINGDDEILCTWNHENSVAIDVPRRYTKGFKSALMFLLASDATRYFAHHWMEVGEAAMEIPCFLEMFQQSPPNNKRNLDALYSEYLALIGFCLAIGCIGPGWTYRCEERQFDFHVMKGDEQFSVSVKSVQFAEVEYFGNHNAEVTNRNQHCRLVRIEDGHNVVVHNCPCEHCSAVPIRAVSVNNTPDRIVLSEFNCQNRNWYESIVTENWMTPDCSGTYELAVIHLVSAKGLYEVRHALNSFNQRAFRGANFRLRDRLSARLVGIDGVAVAAEQPALVDRG